MGRNKTIKKVSLLKPGRAFLQMKHCDIQEMTSSKQNWTWLCMYSQLQNGPIWDGPWAALVKGFLREGEAKGTISHL